MSLVDPNRHARLELRGRAGRIGAEEKVVDVVVSNRARRAPDCEFSERPKFGDFGFEAISPGQPVLTLAAAGDRWFTFTIREDRLQGLTMGSKIALRTAAGDRFEAKVTELRPLGEFAVWRAARAVGDHDINNFLLRADPIGPTPKLEPGMTVWIDEARAG